MFINIKMLPLFVFYVCVCVCILYVCVCVCVCVCADDASAVLFWTCLGDILEDFLFCEM